MVQITQIIFPFFFPFSFPPPKGVAGIAGKSAVPVSGRFGNRGNP